MTIPIMVLRIYILRLVENQMERGLSARFSPRMATLRSNAIRIKTCEDTRDHWEASSRTISTPQQNQVSARERR